MSPAASKRTSPFTLPLCSALYQLLLPLCCDVVLSSVNSPGSSGSLHPRAASILSCRVTIHAASALHTADCVRMILMVHLFLKFPWCFCSVVFACMSTFLRKTAARGGSTCFVQVESCLGTLTAHHCVLFNGDATSNHLDVLQKLWTR